MPSIRVKFASNDPDFTYVPPSPSSTIADLSNAIRAERGIEGHFRFIQLGKILPEDESCSSLRGEIIQCSISELPPSTESRIVPARGFDRLLDAGLSRAEVDDIREDFIATRGGEDDIRAEDEWIDSPDPVNDTSQSEVLIGCLIGFYFGLPALLYLSQRERQVTDRRTVAVLAGLLFNLLYGLCR